MIASSTAKAAAPTYAQVMQARGDAQAAKAEQKRVVSENVAEALNSQRMEGPERTKRAARAKLIEVAKKLQLLRKLFAYNPKEMARALTQVMKELRAAVKAYKDAGGQELGFANDAAKAAVANDDAPKSDEAAKADDDAPADADAKAAQTDAAAQAQPPSQDEQAEDKAAQGDPQPQQTPAQGSAIYDAVVGKMRKSIGEDGLEFVRMVRDMVNGALGIRDMLEAARAQYKAKKPDKETDKIFEGADQEMKALSKDLDDMARDIHNAVPDAGMKLSMDA